MSLNMFPYNLAMTTQLQEITETKEKVSQHATPCETTNCAVGASQVFDTDYNEQ